MSDAINKGGPSKRDHEVVHSSEDTDLNRRNLAVLRNTAVLLTKKDKIMEHATGIMFRLLTNYPHLTSFFPNLKGVASKDLLENKFFQYHSLKIVRTLAMEVDVISDEEKFRRLVEQVAVSHGTFNVTMEEFDLMSLAFKDYLKGYLGPAYTKDVDTSWTRFFRIQNDVVRKLGPLATRADEQRDSLAHP